MISEKTAIVSYIIVFSIIGLLALGSLIYKAIRKLSGASKQLGKEDLTVTHLSSILSPNEFREVMGMQRVSEQDALVIQEKGLRYDPIGKSGGSLEDCDHKHQMCFVELTGNKWFDFTYMKYVEDVEGELDPIYVFQCKTCFVYFNMSKSIFWGK